MADTQAEIRAELLRLARVANSLDQRLEAHFALHRAACINGTDQERAQRRDELHTVIDALLDNAEAIHVYTVRLETLA